VDSQKEQTSRHARAWNCKHVRAFKKRASLSLSFFLRADGTISGSHDATRSDTIRSDAMRWAQPREMSLRDAQIYH